MSLADDLENFSRIPLFAVFDPRAMNALAFRSETRVLRAGDVLFRRDEVSDGGFILTAGRVVSITSAVSPISVQGSAT